ncbi:MAG: ABC transporter permease [Desulfovibrionaceae bacterium]
MFLNLRLAYASLKARKLRTILAMLGVFLGALAFTGVQTVSAIMVRNAEMEAEKMGPNLFAIMAGQVRFRRSGGISFGNFNTNLKVSDARAVLQGVPQVLSVAPIINMTLPVRGESGVTNALVTATWPEYQEVRSFHPALGRFFTEAENNRRDKVVVLGQEIAQRLFGEPGQAVGKQVFIYRAGFRVVGVMEAKGSDLAGVNQDEQVFMPLSTYQRRASNVDFIGGVYCNLADGADVSGVRKSCREILRGRHKLAPGAPDDFSMLEAKDVIQLQRQALDLMQTLGLITSTISFAVGGLGILSIMILMVRARRMEIGIRRAVGGKRSDIVRQFMFESGLLATCGGAAGVVVCLGLVLAFASFTAFPLVLEPFVFVSTLVGSGLLGLFAGSYPAWQASRIVILDVLKA